VTTILWEGSVEARDENAHFSLARTKLRKRWVPNADRCDQLPATNSQLPMTAGVRHTPSFPDTLAPRTEQEPENQFSEGDSPPGVVAPGRSDGGGGGGGGGGGSGGGSGGGGGALREDQVQNAVQFLHHPKVQRASLDQRRKFLRNKGVTDAGNLPPALTIRANRLISKSDFFIHWYKLVE
jgi:hypothetical protein